jgi:hypothetical protein
LWRHASQVARYGRYRGGVVNPGGFRQVILICHTPLVWELADNMLSVGGGCVAMGDQQAASTE